MTSYNHRHIAKLQGWLIAGLAMCVLIAAGCAAEEIPTAESTEGGVTFNPVVTSISSEPDGMDIIWTATVVDDTPDEPVSYLWSFEPADETILAEFSVEDENPGIMSGYDQNVAGTISLTVTDVDGGLTTVSFDLTEGQFPDQIVFDTE